MTYQLSGRFDQSSRWLAAVGAFVASLNFAWATNAIGTNDADSAMVPAWALAHLGRLSMPGQYVNYRMLNQTFQTGGRLYSDRPLGMILASTPGQVFFGEPSRWGVTTTAAILTGLSVWAAFTLWGVKTGWLVTAGTPLLYVGGRTLWPETICVAGLLTALLIIRSGRHLWVLTPLVGFLTLCRAPFGLLAVLILVVVMGRRRAVWWPAAGLLTGVVGLVLYSRVVFGSWSLAGPYPVPGRLSLGSLWVGLISPARGILWWSPWLLFVRLRRDRYTLVLAVAASYVLGSWVLYDAWGGDGWVGYRYALPLAVLAAPVAQRPLAKRAAWLFDVSVAWSCAVAVLAELLIFTKTPGRHAWSTGLPIPITVGLFVAFIVLASLVRFRSRVELRDSPNLPADQATPVRETI